MSIPTITAARIYSGQLRGRRGEESKLSFEQFPYMGLSKVNAGLCLLLFLLTCVVLCLILGVDGSNSYTSFEMYLFGWPFQVRIISFTLLVKKIWAWRDLG